jgi:hypothetical protein
MPCDQAQAAWCVAAITGERASNETERVLALVLGLSIAAQGTCTFCVSLLGARHQKIIAVALGAVRPK